MSHPEPRACDLVQFHPTTTYEDFVQGLRPEIGEVGAFTLRDGPLLEAANRAKQEPHATHVIIDEINRANLPAVFGELYLLLEYRNAEVTLNYGAPFKLPKNLLTATGLTDGVLIYAGTEGSDEVITVGPTQQKIRVISLDLSAKDSRSLLIEKLNSAIATAPLS